MKTEKPKLDQDQAVQFLALLQDRSANLNNLCNAAGRNAIAPPTLSKTDILADIAALQCFITQLEGHLGSDAPALQSLSDATPKMTAPTTTAPAKKMTLTEKVLAEKAKLGK